MNRKIVSEAVNTKGGNRNLNRTKSYSKVRMVGDDGGETIAL